MTLNVDRRGFCLGALAAAALPQVALASPIDTTPIGADISLLPNIEPAANAIVLLDGNADVEMEPFSLTKNMGKHNAFVHFDGNIPLDSIVRFSREAVNAPDFHMGFKVGDEILMSDLIICSSLRSCNQSAEQLALEIHGNRAAAILALNESAHAMGMRNTEFVSPSGYPDYSTGARRGGRTTARDMGTMFMTVDQRWRANPFYASTVRRGGVFLSEMATQVLIRNGRIRRDDPLIVGGRMQVFATGERFMPNEDCTAFKTGQGTIRGRAERKHVGFMIEGRNIRPDIYSVVMDSSRDGLLARTTALYNNTMAALSQQTPALASPSASASAPTSTAAPVEAPQMTLPGGNPRPIPQ